MKHCDNCSKDFNAEQETCPVCGAKLRDITPYETKTAEIVSTTTLIGIF